MDYTRTLPGWHYSHAGYPICQSPSFPGGPGMVHSYSCIQGYSNKWGILYRWCHPERPGTVHNYTGIQGYSDKGGTLYWWCHPGKVLVRSTVTLEYRNTLTKRVSCTQVVPSRYGPQLLWCTGILWQRVSCTDGGHPRSVPVWSTVTMMYRDILCQEISCIDNLMKGYPHRWDQLLDSHRIT